MSLDPIQFRSEVDFQKNVQYNSSTGTRNSVNYIDSQDIQTKLINNLTLGITEEGIFLYNNQKWGVEQNITKECDVFCQGTGDDYTRTAYVRFILKIRYPIFITYIAARIDQAVLSTGNPTYKYQLENSNELIDLESNTLIPNGYIRITFPYDSKKDSAFYTKLCKINIRAKTAPGIYTNSDNEIIALPALTDAIIFPNNSSDDVTTNPDYYTLELDTEQIKYITTKDTQVYINTNIMLKSDGNWYKILDFLQTQTLKLTLQKDLTVTTSYLPYTIKSGSYFEWDLKEIYKLTPKKVFLNIVSDNAMNTNYIIDITPSDTNYNWSLLESTYSILEIIPPAKLETFVRLYCFQDVLKPITPDWELNVELYNET